MTRDDQIRQISTMGTDVAVSYRDGESARGQVESFNPQQPWFYLHATGEDAPRRVRFDEVKSVAFLSAPDAAGREERFPANARLVTVRFADGDALHGIAHSYGGARAGLFLVPTGSSWYEKVYVPLTAVHDVLDVKRLGDILADEGMVSRDRVEEALQQQRGLKTEQIGEILVRRQLLTRDKLDRSLALQAEPKGPRIGEILVEQGFINAKELEEALEIQSHQRRRKLGEVMVEMGIATYKMIAVALAIQYGVPFMELADQAPAAGLRTLVPSELARRLMTLPVSLQEGVLTTAVADPADPAPREALRAATGLVVIHVVATVADIDRAIRSYYG